MNIVDKCSITTGISSLDNEVFIAMVNDELAEEREQHAIPLVLKNGIWSLIGGEYALPWVIAGMACINNPTKQLFIVGWGGQVLVYENGMSKEEDIQRTDIKPVSIIRSVTAIDDEIYAVGMNRQVSKREADRWVEIDKGIVYGGGDITVGLNAIGGFHKKEFYAAGFNGEIWCCNGHQWSEVQSPTNVHLLSLCCTSDGNVYIGGKSGVLLRGRQDSWTVLDIGIQETIWIVHWFKDKLYLLTSKGIYLYINGILEKVRDNILNCGDFLNISSSESDLWVFGRKKVIRYDGLQWRDVAIEIQK